MDLDDYGLTSLARSLAGEQLARELGRQELAMVGAERSHSTRRLGDALRLGRALGLSIAEMERMAGCSRQTIYNVLSQAPAEPDADRSGGMPQLALEVLAIAVAAEGAIPLIEVGKRLQRQLGEVVAAAMTLKAAELVSWSQPRSGEAADDSAVINAAPEAEALLRSRFDDLYLRRSEGFAVYLAVDPTERDELARVLPDVVSRHEAVIIEASVAPSTMVGPELALAVNAPTSRTAVAIALDVWDELRRAADLVPRGPVVRDVTAPSPPPTVESPVLDQFAEGVGEAGSEKAVTAAMSGRTRYAGGEDERGLAARCLTAAAWSMRRAVGQEERPRAVTDADAAWGELSIVRALRLDARREAIQKPLIEALELAADRLGPFRGGEVASFKAPGRSPAVVETVTPTQQDLERMARLAGRAFGAASKTNRNLDITAELRAVFG